MKPLDNLIKAIKEDKTVIQYIELHQTLSKDKVLNEALFELKNLQQQLINLNHVGKYKMAKEIESVYLKKRKSLEENPIVLQYLTLQEEIQDLLEDIKDIVEMGLKIDLT